MRILSATLAALAMATSLPLVPGSAEAKPPPWYQYAVPFTCGTNASDVDRAVPGDYAIAVNVLNANTSITRVLKQVQLTFPPGGEVAGASSDLIQEDVPASSAMQVSCAEILQEFVYPVAPTGLVQGVLVIRSNRVLDVSASHIARGPGGELSQDVEPVIGRGIGGVSLPSAASSVTICHLPPGNPGNAHTIVVGVAAWPAHSGHGDYQGACTNGR